MSQTRPTDHEIDVYSTGIVLEGMTQSDAWRKTFPKSKASDEAVHVKASTLHKLDKVQLRIKEKRTIVRKKEQEMFEQGLDDQVMTKYELARILTKQRRIKITDVADFKNVQVDTDESGDPVYQTVWVIKNSEDIDPDIAMMIKGVTATKNGPKIELLDATVAGKELANIMGWNAAKELDLSSKDGTMTPRNFNDFYKD